MAPGAGNNTTITTSPMIELVPYQLRIQTLDGNIPTSILEFGRGTTGSARSLRELIELMGADEHNSDILWHYRTNEQEIPASRDVGKIATDEVVEFPVQVVRRLSLIWRATGFPRILGAIPCLHADAKHLLEHKRGEDTLESN